MLAPLVQIGSLVADVALFVLEAPAHRQGGIGLLVFQQHELPEMQVEVELEETRGINAALENRRRSAPRRDGGAERLLHRLLAGGEMGGREIERAGDLVIAGDPSVGGQQTENVEPRQGEEILEGVLELRARHAAQADAAFAFETGLVGGVEFAIEPIEQSRALLRGRTRLFLRRHVAVGDGIVDLHPGGEGLGIRELRLQRREIETTLFQIRVMTLDAVLIEKRERLDRSEDGRKEEKGGKEGAHRETCLLSTDKERKTRPGKCRPVAR